MTDVYDSSFLCTYKQIDDDDLYRIQILQAFKILNWDDHIITTSIDKLFNIVGTYFDEILNKLCNEKNCLSHMIMFFGPSPSKRDLFQCLFCIDVFQEAHICISNILNSGNIELCNYKSLEKAFFN